MYVHQTIAFASGRALRQGPVPESTCRGSKRGANGLVVIRAGYQPERLPAVSGRASGSKQGYFTATSASLEEEPLTLTLRGWFPVGVEGDRMRFICTTPTRPGARPMN